MPWALGNAVSGTPRLFTPYVESALYVARYRNWWWQHKRGAKTAKTGIDSPADAKPYPAQKSDKISDVPESDSGNNFGRVPRLGIMDQYMAELMQETLSGIPLWAWLDFLRPFAGEADEGDIRKDVARVAAKVKAELGAADVRQDELTQAIVGIVRAVQAKG